MVTAQSVEKRRLRSSIALESQLDFAAAAFLFSGLAISLGVLLVPIFWGSFWGIPISFVHVVGTYVSWLLLRCLAEHIRLQKKMAGLPYQGAISGQDSETILVCSNCQQLLHSSDSCENCGAKIVPPS